MPHVGRPFPRLVEYWVPPGWFYPSFLPWKYISSYVPAISGVWSFLPIRNDLLSGAGVSSPDRQTVSWKNIFNDGIFHHTMTLTASFHPTDTLHELHWDLLWNVNGVDLATASYTCRQDLQPTAPGAYTDALDLVTGLPCDPPFVTTIEADYATGGTPFPHPTGGGP